MSVANCALNLYLKSLQLRVQHSRIFGVSGNIRHIISIDALLPMLGMHGCIELHTHFKVILQAISLMCD